MFSSKSIPIWLYMAAVILFMPYILTLSKQIEEIAFPVITNQKVFDIKNDNGKIAFSVSLNKKRDCRPSSISWVAKDGKHAYTLVVFNSTGEIVTGKASFESGPIVVGPFTTILPAPAKNADTITSNIYYDCHALFETQQTFAEFSLK